MYVLFLSSAQFPLNIKLFPLLVCSNRLTYYMIVCNRSVLTDIFHMQVGQSALSIMLSVLNYVSKCLWVCCIALNIPNVVYVSAG